MKRILITGKNSYIGQSVINWLSNASEDYYTKELDLKDSSWRESDFSKFDVVFHVAGIAHVSTDPSMEELYYKINRDLTIEAALKAKNEGVTQFIFMSSMIVYGDSRPELENITLETIPQPSNFYGKSKMEAEDGLKELEEENFKIVILRPPMIYGKGSKGNYPKLSKLAQKTPLFPDIDNKRSMLHIDNLTEFIRLMIKNEERGVYYPQNKEYVKTSEMVQIISEVHRKKIILTKIGNIFLKPFINRIAVLNKLFGDLAYDQKISKYTENYIIKDLRRSIESTEKIESRRNVDAEI